MNGSVEYISGGRGEGWFPMLCRLGVETAHRSEVTEEGLQCECMIGSSRVSLPRMQGENSWQELSLERWE